jgi:hypothetical protein
MSDWEYSDDDCPKCNAQLAFRRCNELGCEDGYWEDFDPEGPVPGRCDTCNGKGYEEWCRECGWDMNYKCFLSPKHEAEWKAKQGSVR